MIKRSLYLRIVATFIGVVIISLIISYIMTSLSFKQEAMFEEEVIKAANGVADFVRLTEPERLPALFETLETFNFEILLLDEEGTPYTQTTASFQVHKDTREEVIQASDPAPQIIHHFEDEATRLVGLPINVAGEDLGLFMLISYEDEVRTFKRVTVFALFLVLFIGSVLIVLASRHLVNPIKKVTRAAKKMATGDFNVRLKSKNNDEIGDLMTSFNHMATELGKIDKMRDDFVSNVSHEIQSPLTSIKGFTKALKDDLIPKDHQKEYLDILYQESDRLSRLGENILRLASLDSEHHPYHPVKYRLDEQIRRTVLATEPQWKAKNLQIQLDLASTDIVADRDLMDQVWFNLIANAIKYADDGGHIHVVLKNRNETIVASVEDDGKGIPQEALPHLFERFYKVDKARSSGIKGNGLGLSIVQKIVSLHAGRIVVDSEEGRGTTFTVCMPNKEERNTADGKTDGKADR
ncbi:sensor histidine kinase [Caldalkalibacillus salinus]|uniref:sensor histidine kinase n=1 Tax=Caldalkalibacillus salinus TaxID=2803787 RepID=UPI001921D3CD|nr:sensor histidine kinase [Caldalkalibacillus salinus]